MTGDCEELWGEVCSPLELLCTGLPAAPQVLQVSSVNSVLDCEAVYVYTLHKGAQAGWRMV
jgi:hypothetical protein